MFRRRVLTVAGVGVSSVIAGCGNETTERESESDTDGGDRSAGTESDTGTDADTDPETDTGTELAYDAQTDTGELVLTTFDLPDGFSHLDEELVLASELSADDPEYDRLEAAGITRRHRNQFVEDTDPDDATFVSSTVYICESSAAAEELAEQQIDTYAGDDGRRIETDDYEIPTTVVEAESDEGKPVEVYVGRDRNAVLELLVTGESTALETETVYARKSTKFDS